MQLTVKSKKSGWTQHHSVECNTTQQCRETFTPRPILHKNTLLAEVVEKLKKTGLQAAPPAHCYPGPGDVECDFCTEPRTREDFLQYSCQLTTQCIKNSVSEGDREVTCVGEIQSYPDHPERFDDWEQVLCREGLSGRCYWEAEWSGDYWVFTAVSYKDISRKGQGNDCALGRNNTSWSLCCSPSSYSFCHNNKCTEIPVPSSSRIGVYLDHRAGTLSFYSVSDTMTLLHRVQTTFTQPLYPGFGFGVWFCVNYTGSSVKLCDLG